MINLLITREDKLDKETEKLAKEKNINIIYFPLIKTVPVNFRPVDTDSYDLIVFSSKKGVYYFLEKQKIKKDKPIIAVGNKTASYLKYLGFMNIFLPEESSSKGIENLIKGRFKNKKILHITAKKGKKINLENVERLEIYDTLFSVPENKNEILSMLNKGEIDYVLFSSPSTFKAFKCLFKNYKSFIEKTKIISIGDTTKKEIEKEGIKVNFTPSTPSFEEIIKQL